MPEKLKVALVAAYPASGVLAEEDIKPSYRGTEHPAPWIRALGKGFVKRGDIDFHLFVHSRAVTKVCHGSSSGMNITYIPKREPLRTDPYSLYIPGALALRPHIEKYNPDIVHGFGAERGHGLIASRMNRPFVLFIQGIAAKVTPFMDVPAIYKWFQKRIENVTVNRADGIVTETAFAGDWTKTVNPNAFVQIIPHALNPDFLEANPSYSKNLVLCIGSIDRKKGADTVAQAFIQVAEQSPETLFHFIGAGGSKESLNQMIQQAGLSDRIHFLGTLNREQIIDQMAHARLVVTGSRMDSSPNVVTEAHAAGLPVIGTDVGGIPEMIDDGKDGFIVPVDDVTVMSRRIESIINDPDQCRILGQAGRNKVRLLNDPQTVADMHVEFYRRVLDKK